MHRVFQPLGALLLVVVLLYPGHAQTLEHPIRTRFSGSVELPSYIHFRSDYNNEEHEFANDDESNLTRLFSDSSEWVGLKLDLGILHLDHAAWRTLNSYPLWGIELAHSWCISSYRSTLRYYGPNNTTGYPAAYFSGYSTGLLAYLEPYIGAYNNPTADITTFRYGLGAKHLHMPIGTDMGPDTRYENALYIHMHWGYYKQLLQLPWDTGLVLGMHANYFSSLDDSQTVYKYYIVPGVDLYLSRVWRKVPISYPEHTRPKEPKGKTEVSLLGGMKRALPFTSLVHGEDYSDSLYPVAGVCIQYSYALQAHHAVLVGGSCTYDSAIREENKYNSRSDTVRGDLILGHELRAGKLSFTETAHIHLRDVSDQEYGFGALRIGTAYRPTSHLSLGIGANFVIGGNYFGRIDYYDLRIGYVL